MLVGLAATSLLFQIVYSRVMPDDLTYVQALLSVVKIVQLDHDVPAPAALDVFFVLVPLIGLPLALLFGVNIFNVVRVFFVRQERGGAWQIALADTYREHVVVCGLGRVGYRLACDLLEMRLPVVGINDADSPLVQTLVNAAMPVLIGDVRNPDVLSKAGVRRATTVVVCTDQDMVNIETLFRIRDLNPRARIVLRLFEDELAEMLRETLQVDAVISRSAIAAFAFAHAAVGLEVVDSFQLEGQTWALARIPIHPRSPLVGQSLGSVAVDQDMTILFVGNPEQLYSEPTRDAILGPDDELYVLARSDRLQSLVALGLVACEQEERNAQPILVCGLGHTGYRVVLRLLELGRSVAALNFDFNAEVRWLEERGVPVIVGDFRQRAVLEQAGVAGAAAVVACTDDEMTNLVTVLHARESNPDIRSIMRLFEEGLGERLQQTFGIDAVHSTSAIASPAFLSAALQMEVARTIEVNQRRYFLAHLTVKPLSALTGVTIADLDRQEELTVALHARAGQVYVSPSPRQQLHVGDGIVVLASQENLRELARRNRSLSEMVRR